MLAGVFLFGISPHLLPLFPLGRCAFALPCIVCLLCQLPRVIMADAQSKRLCGAYKRTITYHIRPMGQDGATSANQLSARTGIRDAQDSQPIGAHPLADHRPPPHPSPPHPSLGAGTATGKIPPLENFLCKSNPSSNNLLGTLQCYGTLFERGIAWTLSRYPPLYRGGRA
jgi:hypothetical protein